MRVVTRGPRQTVKIGQDVTVTILEIRGVQVRIGVAAPPATAVLRQEIVAKPRAPRQRPPDMRR